ncbi:MAG TPA: serine/threonine-protein kinase [Acidimicrobiales bacterium]|nr:serine/threonine-protein kinase [Acidimicrobiales bacterium]
MTSIADVLGGHYRLVRLLGRGGMSDVYEALDERNGSTVALKIVRSGDPEFVRRLTQEARALESFEHPGLIRLLDTGLAGDDAYLVMEFVDGPTLAESLKKGPLSAPATGALGARLADALAYVHERGIVHRDVKPSNILQSSTGEAWIGDFGVAQLHDATTLTAVGTALGTVVYMAPEQLEGGQVGPSADIWSLGIVLLECLTGRRVYQGSPSEIVASRMAGPVPVPKDLPVPWKLVLGGMLDFRPEQRLSGAQVATLLSTSVFATPWRASNSDETERLSAVSPEDLTVLMPGVGAALTPSGDDTVIDTPSRGATTAPRHLGTRRLRPAWLMSGAVIAAAAAVALIFLLGSNPSKPPTTTLASTTTTSSTIISSSSALARLVSDLASAQAAGAIDPASQQSISQDANQALIDQGAGNLTRAENDLQRAANVLANAIQGGQISLSEGAILQRDLSALAASLGVAAPSATTTPTSPGNPGPGHGKGKGH